MNVEEVYNEYFSLLKKNNIKIQEDSYYQNLLMKQMNNPDMLTHGAKKQIYKLGKDLLYTIMGEKEIYFALQLGCIWLQNQNKYSFKMPIIHYVEQYNENSYHVIMQQIHFDFQMKSIENAIFVDIYDPKEHEFTNESILDKEHEILTCYIEAVVDFQHMIHNNNLFCIEFETLIQESSKNFYLIDFEHCFKEMNEQYFKDKRGVIKNVARGNYALKLETYQDLKKARFQVLDGKINKQQYQKVRNEFLKKRISKSNLYRVGSSNDEIDLSGLAPLTPMPQYYDEPEVDDFELEPRTPERKKSLIEPETPFKPFGLDLDYNIDTPKTPERKRFTLEPETPQKMLEEIKTPKRKRMFFEPETFETPKPKRFKLEPETPRKLFEPEEEIPEINPYILNDLDFESPEYKVTQFDWEEEPKPSLFLKRRLDFGSKKKRSSRKRSTNKKRSNKKSLKKSNRRK